MSYGATVSLLIAAVGSMQTTNTVSDGSFDFTRSYQVWAQGNDGSCLYVVGDVYVKRTNLEAALSTYQKKDLGVEFLIEKTTPVKCANIFDEAATKAGYLHHRTRLAGDRDMAKLHP